MYEIIYYICVCTDVHTYIHVCKNFSSKKRKLLYREGDYKKDPKEGKWKGHEVEKGGRKEI